MNYLIAVLILIVVLAYESIFFAVYATSLLEPIKGLIYLVLLVLCLNHNRIKYDIKNQIVALYLMLMLYLLIPAVLNGADGMLYWIKIALKSTYLLIFVMLFRIRGEAFIKAVSNVFFWTGLLLAIQTIIFFILLVSGHAPDPVYLHRFETDDFDYASYGIFGFANSMSEKEGMVVFRTQSFFSEATTFALFQIFPLYVALSRVRLNALYIGAAIIILVSIISTFSFSGLVGVACGLVSLTILGAGQRMKMAKIVVLLIILPIIAVSGYLYVTNEENFEEGSYQSYVLAKGESSTSVRTNWSQDVFNAISLQPFGVNYVEFTGRVGALPQAPVHWFLVGGYIGGVFMLFIQLWLWIKYFLPGLNSPIRFERAIAACCISFMITGIVHAQWDELEYYLPVALLIWLQSRCVFNRKNHIENGVLVSL